MIVPVELLYAIAELVSARRDLAKLRTVDRTFRRVATPWTFRSVEVKTGPSAIDARVLDVLYGSEDLSRYVEEIVVAYEKECGGLDAIQNKQDNREDVLSAALSHLDRFPSLRSLQCHIPAALDDRHTVLKAITSSHLPLKRLTIDHFPPLLDILGLEYNFPAILTELETLSISVDSNSPYADHDSFWELFPGRILAHSQTTLASLTLSSDDFVGLAPVLDLSGLHYPRLTSLTLKGFMFGEGSSLEDFIIRHRETLRSLELENCCVGLPGVQVEPSRSWSNILNHFSNQLTHLVEFTIRRTTNTRSLDRWLASDCVFLYAHLKTDPLWGRCTLTPAVGLMQGEIGFKDQDARRKLEGVVEARRIYRAW